MDKDPEVPGEVGEAGKPRAFCAPRRAQGAAAEGRPIIQRNGGQEDWRRKGQN